MHKSKWMFPLIALLVWATVRPCLAQSGTEAENKWISVLNSDAGLKEKADACRALAQVGGRSSVPVLARLLADEQLAHMARYALEPIPDPSVDSALREALGKLQGRLLVGVIGSIGVRRDRMAVDPLARFLRHEDAEVAQAAARALGSLGTEPAARALQRHLASAQGPMQIALCEGLLRAAEALADDSRSAALAIYDRLRSLDAPHFVQAAGLRGAVLNRGQEGWKLLLPVIRNGDFALAQASARIAMEIADPALTGLLAEVLPDLPPDRQILFAQVLGWRRDPAALPALTDLTTSEQSTVRIAAIRALPEIGDDSVVPLLLRLARHSDDETARAAQTGLAAMPGADVDRAISARLQDTDAEVRRIAVDQLGQRRTLAAIPALLKAAQDPDVTVRTASLKVLGDLVSLSDFPALVDLLLQSSTSAEIQAAENAVTAVCLREAQPAAEQVNIVRAVYGDLPDGSSKNVTRRVRELIADGALSVDASNSNFGDPVPGIPKKLRVQYTVGGNAATQTVREGETLTLTATVLPSICTDVLCQAAARAPKPAKLALLRILTGVGGAEALAAVRAATEDADSEVRTAALRALCDWPSDEVLPDVLRLAETSPNPTLRILAVRGYIRLISQQSVPDDEKLAGFKQALSLATRTDEKKLVLAALRDVPSSDSLALAAEHLATPALAEEAAVVAIAIAEKVIERNPDAVARAMSKVSKAPVSSELTQEAKALLQQARK